MADAAIDLATEFAHRYEPKRKFRWILEIDGIDSWVIRAASRPQFNFEETPIEYMNWRRYFAGKATWSSINITMYDPIAPSAAQKVQDWVRLCYEVSTGRMGYADMYQKTVTLKLLDPVGAVVEKWVLYGAWLQDVNFNDLDYASSDALEISCTMRYNWAIQEY